MPKRKQQEWPVNGEWEVEKIVDWKIEDKVNKFYVKWKGWASSHNSWEPESHLSGCTEAIDAFMATRSKRSSFQPGIAAMDPRAEALRTLEDLPARANGRAVIIERMLTTQNQDAPMARSSTTRPSYTYVISVSPKQHRDELIRECSAQLAAWEAEINALISRGGGKESGRICIENVVDLAGPPPKFEYMTDYIFPADVRARMQEHAASCLVGCMCASSALGKCSSRSECCFTGAGAEFAYDTNSRLRLLPGRPIYECNAFCNCAVDCPNRVVQKGRTLDLTIFRTKNKGWGVKTTRRIKQGEFVMEYIGEVISAEEGDRRSHQYDREGLTYLMDLDFNDDAPQYTIDATNRGNVAHFINHSCDANLIVHGVWVNHLDRDLPRLAFFASRSIDVGEELTFDYKMHQVSAATEDDKEFLKAHGSKFPLRVPCKCGAAKCRKYL